MVPRENLEGSVVRTGRDFPAGENPCLSQGLHRFSKTKAVNVCFISRQIDEWFAKLKRKDLEIRDSLEDQANFPVRTFVIYDTGGYFLEFDWFLEDGRNTKILKYLTSTPK